MPAIVAYSAIFPPSPDNDDDGKMAETKGKPVNGGPKFS